MHCRRAGRRPRRHGRLAANGVPDSAIEQHLTVLGNKPAMEAALAWYRARGAIRVPTLYIGGDADDTIGRVAAEGTVDFIAAPYRFEVLPGVGAPCGGSGAGAGLRIIAGTCRRPSDLTGTGALRKCCHATIGACRHEQRQ